MKRRSLLGSAAAASATGTPRPLAVLVMSADASRRGDWAKFFEAQGIRAIRCAGPKATTCVVEFGAPCPLHEEADLIFYDEESVTPRLEERLDLITLGTPIAYASTMHSRDGKQYPITERVRPAARPSAPSR